MNTSTQSALTPVARQRQGDDPIFTLNAEAFRRAAAGESILNATLGALTDENGKLATMACVADALGAVPAELGAGYAPISGVPAFVNAVIEDLFGSSDLAAQAMGVATPGGTGGVYQAMVNFLEPGHSALTTNYYWGPYGVIAAHAGRGVDSFNMFDDQGRFDVPALRAGLEAHVASQGRALLILNFPCQNPTGYSLDATEWAAVTSAVAEVAMRAPVAVLLDAAYFRFAGANGRDWLDAIPGLLAHATVLVAWTASKSFAQYGARIGALIALHPEAGERDRLGNALGYSCRATWSNCNHLGQLAITKLLTEPDLKAAAMTERAALRTMLQHRVDAFNADLRDVIRVPRYEGGFFVSAFTPDAQHTAAVMRERGVYVVPLNGAVRVALCATPVAAVPRLVDALEIGIQAALTR